VITHGQWYCRPTHFIDIRLKVVNECHPKQYISLQEKKLCLLHKLSSAFNLCPCAFFKWAPHHEGIIGREWMYSSTHSLTSALGGGKWSASHLAHFTPRERAPGAHWIGGWVGPRAILDVVVKRKNVYKWSKNINENNEYFNYVPGITIR
jgi:hypothetical protein